MSLVKKVKSLIVTIVEQMSLKNQRQNKFDLVNSSCCEKITFVQTKKATQKFCFYFFLIRHYLLKKKCCQF